MIDLNLISKGEDYKKLKKSYIIFICKFDPFGENLCCYTFENVCLQQRDLKLEDESVKIFLNPYGNTEGISEEQKELFRYLREEKTESIFTKELEEEVESARKQEEWRVEYMTLLMRDQENREKGYRQGRKEGRKEGRKKGITEGEARLSKLVELLLNADQDEKMRKVLSDAEYREEMYKKYNL